MSNNQIIEPADINQSRQQLIQELAELKSQLAAKNQHCEDLEKKLLQFKSKRLIESENHFSRYFSSMQEGFGLAEIILDDAGKPCDYRLLYVNDAYGHMIGIAPEGAKGKTFLQILPDADPHLIQSLCNVAQTGKPILIERYDSPAGKWHLISAFCPEKGQFIHIIIDITELKLAEGTLRDSEQRYRSLFEASMDGIFLTSPDGPIHDANPAACELFGMSREEICLLGRKGVVDLNDERLAGLLEERQRTGRFRGELRQRRKDGSLFESEATSLVFVDSKGETNSWTIIRDITERKRTEEALRESEERLKLVLEGSQLGYWDWNIETGDVHRNRRWAEMLGYSLEEIEYTIKQWTDLHHPDDRAAAWKSIQEHLDGKTPEHRIEYRMRAKDGQYKWILDQARVVKRDAQGKPIRMSGTHIDITKRKQYEEEHEKLHAQLAQAQKMESVGRLAGGVAHDFNNMLGVILGYTELILEQVGPGVGFYPDLLEIQKAAQRSADITRQLLAFARKQTIAPKVLELNNAVEGMLRMLRRLIGEDIDLSWLPGRNLAKIRIDPSQINQILANLCVNAQDAITGSTGTGKISIETGNATFDNNYCAQYADFIPGDYVQLTVSDSGCGMDKQTLDNLFEPFFTTKGVDKGTGLGLATVYGIVMQNNGFIHVYSEPGHGTTFKIYFPQHVSNGDDSPDKVEVKKIELGHETILLVEDEPAILNITTIMLEGLGYQVISARTPNEAIRLAKEFVGEIHLLITDVIMPEMNGRNLARNILSLYPGLKRLFMSGYTANVIAHHGVLDENIKFIQKPFSRETLGAKVRETLDETEGKFKQ